MKKTIYTLGLSMLTAAGAMAQAVPAKVVIGEPGQSLPDPAKERCELIFINSDGTPAQAQQRLTPVRRVVTDPQTPPFNCDFTGENDMDFFTIVDANNDNKKWERNTQGFAALMYNTYQSANDYLISPPMQLEADHIYTFTTHARPYQSQYPEKIEMWAGQAPTAAGMTVQLLETTTLTETAWNPLVVTFAPEAAGVYYFAVRGVSDADQYALLINDFSISAGVSTLVPQAPEMVVTRDANGEPKATVAVTPSLYNTKGEPVAALTALNIYRDGTLIKTYGNPQGGTTYSYEDLDPTVAMHKYTAECVNEYGTGLSAESTTFTGIYYAKWPDKVTPTIGNNEGQVRLDWDACLTDQNGNPLREDQVVYDIYRILGGAVTLHAQGVETNHYIDQVCGENDPQCQVQYTVMSRTSYGQSAGTGSGIYYAGAPYELPYIESFPNGEITSLLNTRGLANYAAGWEIANMEDYDLPYPTDGSDMDGGFVYHRAYNAAEEAEIQTGKIKIPAQIQSATLTFDTYLNGTDATPNQNSLDVYGYADGEQVTLLLECTQHGPQQWGTFSVDLTPYAGKTIRLGWHNIVRSHVLTALDNIRVEAVYPTSVENIAIDGGDAEYFTLQGVRVAHPQAGGIYICRRGSDVTKAVIR